jgi:hypothetical protein
MPQPGLQISPWPKGPHGPQGPQQQPLAERSATKTAGNNAHLNMAVASVHANNREAPTARPQQRHGGSAVTRHGCPKGSIGPHNRQNRENLRNRQILPRRWEARKCLLSAFGTAIKIARRQPYKSPLPRVPSGGNFKSHQLPKSRNLSCHATTDNTPVRSLAPVVDVSNA